MDFQGLTPILSTRPMVEDTLNLSKAITEYGILVIIAAVFLIATICIFRRILDSYAKTVDGIIPKLEEASKSINDLRISINELMSAHNAHTNQSMRTLERDTKEIREELSYYQKTINDLDGALNSLQENYNTILKIIIHNADYGRFLSNSHIVHCDDEVNIDNTRSSHEYNNTKKEGDKSK